jgi:hypothetical protein
MKNVRVPLEKYVWRLSQPGYTTVTWIEKANQVNVRAYLLKSGFPGMQAVFGGRVPALFPFYRLPAADVNYFFIDRNEATNEDYKKFVDAGGYRRREFWKQPFVKDGHAVSWEEALGSFHDSTGHSGPATWQGGTFPKGRDNYPVAGVSWYEAAAYAEFAGKRLPTMYHWLMASQLYNETWILQGSNFDGTGTWPVGSEGALSGYGTTDMLGNVKEWCWNETRDGKRILMGGGFGEPEYMLANADPQSPWDRRANFGFRCVRYVKPPSPQTTRRLDPPTHDFRKEKPAADGVYKAYLGLYQYDKFALHPRVEATTAGKEWSRERITIDAAYGRERITIHLFLPKNSSPPFQTVVYHPGRFATQRLVERSRVLQSEKKAAFVLRSGRALMLTIYQGMDERFDGHAVGGTSAGVFRDHQVAWAKDLGRSIDYLETRKDIDAAKLGYFVNDGAGFLADFLPAIEKRIKVAVLSSDGLPPLTYFPPEVDPFNFVPRLTIPVLMLNGRYDGLMPLDSSQRPLFDLLGTPAKDKKHVLYEGGTGAFPRPEAERECLEWFDKYLGPVRR